MSSNPRSVEIRKRQAFRVRRTTASLQRSDANKRITTKASAKTEQQNPPPRRVSFPTRRKESIFFAGRLSRRPAPSLQMPSATAQTGLSGLARVSQSLLHCPSLITARPPVRSLLSSTTSDFYVSSTDYHTIFHPSRRLDIKTSSSSLFIPPSKLPPT